MPPFPTAPLGVVLAGGLARRMGGADKALLPLGGRPVLAHVLTRFAPQCSDVILNVNGDPARFAAFGHAIVPDDLPDHPGPLAGLLAALDWAAAHRPATRHVVSIAGDTPFLPADFVSRLDEGRIAADRQAACAASGGRIHPVEGLWAVELRHDLRHVLTVLGLRKLGLWAERHHAAIVDWPIGPPDPFLNINTPDDLAEAERWAAQETP